MPEDICFKFKPGDWVKLKITGQKAMVISTDQFKQGPGYQIRLENLSRLWVIEFEIEIDG